MCLSSILDYVIKNRCQNFSDSGKVTNSCGNYFRPTFLKSDPRNPSPSDLESWKSK